MESPNERPLLQEYGSCDAQVSRCDTIIWQRAALIFSSTLFALAYFGKSLEHTLEGFLLEIVVAIGAVSVTILWSRLALQWHGYQAVAFHRMREIETQLGMWHYRYSLFLRRSPEERQILVEEMSE